MPKIKLNPDDYEDVPIDDKENPELTEEDFANARPFKEVFPEQYAQWEAGGRAPIPVKRIGRPPVETPKVQIGFRLSPDVVARIRASGPGYNARVETVLREAIDTGRI